MSIGTRIRDARLRLNLTQEELSKKVGVTKSAIANYENGVSTPKIEILYALMEALSVDANYLYEKEFSDDDDLQRYLEELKNRPEMRMLFKLSSTCTKEEVEQAVRIIEALKRND